MDNYFEDMVRSAAQASVSDEKPAEDKNLTILQKLDCVLLNLSIFKKDLDEVKKQQAELVSAVKMMNDANTLASHPLFIAQPYIYPTTGSPILPNYTTSITYVAGNT